jgi:sec-independent protein translocase protein TatA
VFSSFGPLEIALVILVLLLVFGSKRLPTLGRQLGSGMREFKESITGENKHEDDDDARPALAQSPDAPPVAAPESQPADAAPERRG